MYIVQVGNSLAWDSNYIRRYLIILLDVFISVTYDSKHYLGMLTII